ncbi:unnamed protein product [Callosobruchus maculatus]|uniref:Uncharacterized protein n=1 Tax=Callosobruchus maculatus TaxID=64391 RepID=A0A653CVF1_CALMS|nr:unnamed protein product [Callosobruchus maculatus]
MMSTYSNRAVRTSTPCVISSYYILFILIVARDSFAKRNSHVLNLIHIY